MADLLDSLALAQRHLNQQREALETFTQSQKLLEDLVAEKPGQESLQLDLCTTNNNLGALHMHMTRYRDASACFARAAQLSQKLVDTRPAMLRYATWLGGTYSNIGTLEAAQNHYGKALPHFTRAARTLRAVLRRGDRDRAEDMLRLAINSGDLSAANDLGAFQARILLAAVEWSWPLSRPRSSGSWRPTYAWSPPRPWSARVVSGPGAALGRRPDWTRPGRCRP